MIIDNRPWLDTDIPSKHFVYLEDVFETPSRNVFKTSARRVEDVSKTYVDDQKMFAG